ncbi:MAG TPA: alpha/beta hydrolase [Anaeromyxobacteraceae bacterium]|nr:alpha/beta hydrolase [Anaeromyxobacteraceae bacterium]
MEQGVIEVEPGIRISWKEQGSGEPALLVPNGCWVAGPMAPLAATHRIVSYDLRGRGLSSPVDDPSRLGVAFDVADLEAVRRHLGLSRPVVLAHSYGSAVALLHALDHPRAVGGLVLVGAFAARRVPWHDTDLPTVGEMIRPPGSTRLGALRAGKVHRTDPRSYAREWMRHYLLPQQVARKENVDLVPLDACDLPNEFPERWIPGWLERIYPSLGDWDWRPRLPALDVPVLLVWGETDRGPVEVEQEWLSGLSRGEVAVVPGAGHWPFCENPGAFFPAVERFLSR